MDFCSNAPYNLIVSRVNNQLYEVELKDKKIIVNFNDSGIISPNTEEFFYNLVCKIGMDIENSKSKVSSKSYKIPQHYEIGTMSIELIQVDKSIPLARLFTNFFHDQGDDGLIKLEIMIINYENLETIDRIAAQRFNQAIDSCMQSSFPSFKMLSTSAREMSLGIVAKYPSEYSHSENLTHSFYDSSFTVLATLAHQKYEKDFNGKDFFQPKDNQYAIQIRGPHTVLIDRKNSKAGDQALNRATLEKYRDFIIRECGKEKFEYICHQYRLDFEEDIAQGNPLTPEHIYRINIGVGMLEFEDLQKYYQLLPSLSNAIEGKSDKELHENNLLLEDFLNDLESILTIGQKRQLLKAVSAHANSSSPSLVDLIDWLSLFKNYSDIKALPIELLNEFMTLFFIDSQERKKSFSGKEIKIPIHSGYTIAGKKEYKPWIDQQEVLQTLSQLEDATNFHQYCEILDHIICKKHLFHRHPTKGLTVGTILPAPKGDSNEKRWYEVSEATYNGYGRLTYSLTPLVNDESLPTIKLYRSTSSDPYAIFGSKTVRSDVNLLNPAGYEGLSKTDCYENALVNERTLPLWVAYHLIAEKLLTEANGSPTLDQMIEIKKNLAKANEFLWKEEEAKFPPMRLRDVVKKYDGIITNLYHLGCVDASLFHKIRTFHYQQTFPSTLTPSEIDTYEKIEKVDTEELIKQILSYERNKGRSEQFHNQMHEEMRSLVKDLSIHCLSDIAKNERRQHLESYLENIGNRLTANNLMLEDALNERDLENARAITRTWSQEFSQLAEERKENLSSKKPSNILSTGHSLGGGYAQIFVPYFLTNRNRIPCPNKKCQVFAFDAPGIAREDNEKFKQFVIEHSPLMEKLNVHFEIYQQQEKGDPVPAGHTHLGSATSINEAAALLNSIKFEGALFERLPDAKNPIVASAMTAHATQFLQGKEGEDFVKTDFDPYTMGIWETAESLKDNLPQSLKEKSQNFRNKVWNFPVSPPWANYLQSHAAVHNLAGMAIGEKWIQESAIEFYHFLDAQGNLSVNSEGIVQPPPE